MKTKEEKLLNAVLTGNLKEVKEIVKRGFKTEFKDKNGHTLYEIAAYSGFRSIYNHIVRSGAYSSKHRFSRYIAAVISGNMGEIKKQMKKDKNTVFMKDRFGNNALVFAALAEDIKLIRYLMEKKVEPDSKNEYGNNVLTICAEKGRLKAINELLANRSRVNVNSINKRLDTALMYAAGEGHSRIVERLIKEGADVNIQNRYGNTALISAASNNRMKSVQHLILSGAKLNERGFWRKTALFISVLKGHYNIAKILLEAGADPDIQDEFEETPLGSVTVSGDFKMARLLLRYGANPNIKMFGGKTSLMIASERGYTKLVKALVQYGANVKEAEASGKTALIFSGNAKIRDIFEEIECAEYEGGE